MPKQIKKVSEPSVYHLKIKEWPQSERPREKLLARGAQSLTEVELLAILIRSGAGKITAVDLAKTLLKDYETLHRISTRSVEELRQYKGLGDTKAITLIAAFELGRRASKQQLDKIQINSPDDIYQQYRTEFRDLKQEVFKVVLLDSANHVLRIVKISDGILNSALVHPREVFYPAINEPAASVILLHNHPSGNPEPSADDIQITRQIVEAGKILGIPVHDHIIIALGKFTSFAEKGLI
jgi:DNA repair protein RadC